MELISFLGISAITGLFLYLSIGTAVLAGITINKFVLVPHGIFDCKLIGIFLLSFYLSSIFIELYINFILGPFLYGA